MLMLLLIAALILLDVGIVVARRRRSRFTEEGDAFRCRFRACGYPSTVWPNLPRRWSRRMWARWIGDVLTIRRGPVFPRIVALPAQVCRAGVYRLTPGDARGFGWHPIAVGLRLSDGSLAEMATAEEERLALVGPYLAAAINDLPQAPVPRHGT